MNTKNFINGRITIDRDLCNGKPTLRDKSTVGWVEQRETHHNKIKNH